MALSRRPVSSTSAITEFWSWWQRKGAASVEKAMKRRQPMAIAAEMTKRVRAIDERLAWEFGGDAPNRQLVVSAEGNMEARPAAERWLRAARAVDGWSYFSSRQRMSVETAMLDVGGATLDLSQLRFAVKFDDARARVAVTAGHPEFGSIPTEVAQQVLFLGLDATLGEDAMERWVGGVRAVEGPITGDEALTPSELAAAVDDFAARYPGDTFAFGDGSVRAGRYHTVLIRQGARAVAHPIFDQHTVAAVPFEFDDPDGPPTPDSLDWLTGLEGELDAILGIRGIWIAHVTVSGARTFHIYSDSEDQNVTEALRAWVAAVPGAEFATTYDPGWSEVRDLVG